jgi:small multidrug resistance pump
MTLKTLPLGVAYAIWSGIGTALVAVLGWLVYRQQLDLPAIAGISLIIIGTIVLNLFSKVAAH